MGYSSRYHVASLAAVFLALAVGILIGAEIGGDVIDSTRENLEQSLTEDLDQARVDNERLRSELEWSRELGSLTILPLVEGRLTGRRYALIGFGSLPDSVSEPVSEVVRDAGGRLVGVGEVREPPSRESLGESLEGTPFGSLGERPGLLASYGRIAGRQMIGGGEVFDRSRDELMSRSSGGFGALDGVILHRGPLPDADVGSPERIESRTLTSAMVDGMLSTPARLVAVEEFGAERTSIPFFSRLRISSIDSIGFESGRLALVYALRGAQGSFGVKETADALVPEPVGTPGGTGAG